MFLLPALCGEVAKRLLEYDAELLEVMVQSMGDSYPDSVRVEGFKLALRFSVIN